MPLHDLPTPARARFLCFVTAFTALASLALATAAALAPAPAAIVPLVLAVAIGLPMVFAVELPAAIAALKAHRHVKRLRRDLSRLPEVPHPVELDV